MNRGPIAKDAFGIMELRCFSSMFPSLAKGKIVSMNVIGIPMGDYPNIFKEMT